MTATRYLTAIVVASAAWAAHAAPIIFSASGANAASIQATVDAFRASLGALNANVAGSFGSGRREINWDGVPDALAAPNNLPANFFNVNSPRGVVFSTPGTGFEVSAKTGNPTSTTTQFGNIDPNYPTFWHARGYGLFAANPLGESIFTNNKHSKNLQLKKGESVRFRYRVIVDEGANSIPAAKLNELADAFAKWH